MKLREYIYEIWRKNPQQLLIQGRVWATDDDDALNKTEDLNEDYAKSTRHVIRVGRLEE